MMRRIAGLGLLVLLISWFHPVHVSVTNMEIDPESGDISVSFKLFSDDFENLIMAKYGVRLNITSQEDPGEKIEAVNRYFAEAFHCRVNGRDPAGLEYIKTKLGEEAIWLYYVYRHPGKIRRMEIQNTIMLDYFDDQTNLLIVSYRDTQNGYRLNKKNTELSFNVR